MGPAEAYSAVPCTRLCHGSKDTRTVTVSVSFSVMEGSGAVPAAWSVCACATRYARGNGVCVCVFAEAGVKVRWCQRPGRSACALHVKAMVCAYVCLRRQR